MMKALITGLLLIFATGCCAELYLNKPHDLTQSCDLSAEFVSSWLAGERDTKLYSATWSMTSKTQARICITESIKGIKRVVAMKLFPVNESMFFTSGTCVFHGQQAPFVFALTSDSDSDDDLNIINAWIFDIDKMLFIELPALDVSCVSS